MGTWDNCSTTCSEYSTWQVMEEYLPRQLQEQYRRIFNNYDVDGTGVIHIEDVAEVVSKYGKVSTVENIRNMLKEINGHCFTINEDYLDFPEFLSVMANVSKNCIPEDEMMLIFKRFDQDGDGFIGKRELWNLFSRIGEPLTENELEEMIQEADKDGDGLVSYQDFVRLITNSSDNVSKPKEKDTKDFSNKALFQSQESILHSEDETLSNSSDETYYLDNDSICSSKSNFNKVQRTMSLKTGLTWIKKSHSRNKSSVSLMAVDERRLSSDRSQTLPTSSSLPKNSLSKHKRSYSAASSSILKTINYSEEKPKKALSSSMLSLTSNIFRRSKRIFRR